MRRDLALIRATVGRYWGLMKARRAFDRGTWKPSWERWGGHNEGVVIAYHRVNGFPKLGFRPTKDLAVNTDDFEMHLAFLKQHCSVIPLRNVIECLQSGERLPERSVALTFDDGYEDNYTDAYPLLMKHNLPATMFVSAGLLDGTTPLWHDALEMLLAGTKRSSLILDEENYQLQFSLRTTGQKWYAYERLSQYIRRLQASRRPRFMLKLGLLLGFPDFPKVGPEQRLLRWDQIQEMQKSGLIEFGSHTMFHNQLTRLDEQEADFEIGESRRRIMEKTGQEVSLFSYPNGTATDVSEPRIRQLQSHGYRGACTMDHQRVRAGVHPFLIPRVCAKGFPVHGLVMTMVAVLGGDYRATTGDF